MKTEDAFALFEHEYEKQMAYRVMSFRDTLSASASHWKVSRPEGLTIQRTTKLIIAFSHVFAG